MFKKSKNQSQEKIPTLISKGCTIEGQIRDTAFIRVEGSILGDIIHAENIIVGEYGLVEGNIQTQEIVIFGAVKGNVTADSIEIKSSGKVTGQIKTRKLQVESGAIYNGMLAMEITMEEEDTSY